MGRSGSGKSSMRSIIFSNYSAFDTRRLGATIDVEHSHLRFLGHMTLNLWDCGGQDVFIDNYFSTQKDHIFRMVEVLIHVFDVGSKKLAKDIDIFQKCIKNLREFSPDAKVFVLLHKMDLMQLNKRDEIFNTMMKTLEEHAVPFGFTIRGFQTSIWDESLYKAWSSIVCSLIPNMSAIQNHLKSFAEISEAQEAVLFEKTTFLVISHASATIEGDENLDPKRFEKISNIIKTYKQSCSKMKSQLKRLTLHGHNCSAYIDNLTGNTFIMVVMPPREAHEGTFCDDDGSVIVTNIRAAREWFEKVELLEG